MDYELTLFDRKNVIKDTINKYGEENFYLSFSGGKDSTILHYLLDMALPNNRIPRVFINTGIEYNYIVEFVKELASKDDRFIILAPQTPIIPTLKQYGYPFKSKQHSHNVAQYQRSGMSQSINVYVNKANTKKGRSSLFHCPEILKYQFTEEFKQRMKLSDLCCQKMKKEPVKKWQKESHRNIVLTGMRKEEGGNRLQLTCITTDKDGKIQKFHPLVKVDEQWENEFVKRENIQLCKLYYPPFNFQRTGCKGCPFALHLQEQLDILKEHLPNEYKSCEVIWKPVYEEYRRLGYRLRSDKEVNLFDFNWNKE